MADSALDELVDDKVISVKDYGKSKVYIINQDRFGEVDEEQLYKMDEDISEKKWELEDLVEA